MATFGRQRIWPIVHVAACRGAIALSPAQWLEVRDHTSAGLSWSIELERRQRALTAALRAAGIDHAVLKGSAHAQALWPWPDVRPSSDIDLLVRGADLPAACHVVVDSGGSRVRPGPDPAIVGRFAKGIAYRFDDRTEVDLHRLVIDGPIGIRAARGWDPVDGPGTMADAPAAPAMVVAALHAVIPADQRRLVSLLDVAHGIARVPADEARAAAIRWGVEDVLAIAVRRAARLFDLPDAPLVRWAGATPPSRTVVRILRARRAQSRGFAIPTTIETIRAESWTERAGHLRYLVRPRHALSEG